MQKARRPSAEKSTAQEKAPAKRSTERNSAQKSVPERAVKTSAPRGFAAMDAEKRRAIARKGGESVPAEKRSFYQNRELAAQAGRKGGQNVADEHRSFSRDRTLAAEAGQKGGQKSNADAQTPSSRTSRRSGGNAQPMPG